MKCRLYIQIPEPKDMGIGILAVDKILNGYFMKGKDSVKIVAELERVRLASIGDNKILLYGMESKGYDKNDRQKFEYQEWEIIPIQEESDK
jgi:hypothetical protein